MLITHLAEVVQTHAARLLGREDVKALIDSVRRTHPVVVEELTPALLTTGEIQRVLQGLLAEGISVRDLVRVFEALSQRAKTGADLDGLVEAARLALGPAIADTFAKDGLLQVITLDPGVEQQARRRRPPRRPGRRAEPARRHARAVRRLGDPDPRRRRARGPFARPGVRPRGARPLRRLLAPHVPRLAVLSYAEIDPSLRIETSGVVSGGAAIAA
ncbi:hypothetical protein GCM10025868_41880 [Angustibacter aerolatus]|uniref:Uncharacterized protein n=1 Tax=Angustibacter aerolatus TaxID=1162965 RepID=A0ABQ6JNI0_9ACTN|nr:hypothetical protein GCM10025868_41880 [Angustibacter aerolatus]